MGTEHNDCGEEHHDDDDINLEFLFYVTGKIIVGTLSLLLVIKLITLL